MKKRSVIAIIMILSMLLALVLGSCAKKPETLEAYVKSNEEAREKIDGAATEQGMKVEIKDNAITYTYDLANAEGASDEALQDPAVKKSFEEVLEAGKDQFVSTCQQLESETGLSGITITVTFVYQGEVIATRTYSAND